MSFLNQFAAETTQSTDIFTALGIDWRLLILQIIAFLVLVAILGKFVYPWLMKSVDERQARIEAAQDAAAKAQHEAVKKQAEIAELLADARREAADIVDTAKLEAAEMVSESEKKAQKTAEKTVADAHDQLQKDVAKARDELHDETLQLVALATGKIVDEKVSASVDASLIEKALKEVK